MPTSIKRREFVRIFRQIMAEPVHAIICPDKLLRSLTRTLGVSLKHFKTQKQLEATRRRSLRARLAWVRRKNKGRLTATEIDLGNKLCLLG